VPYTVLTTPNCQRHTVWFRDACLHPFDEADAARARASIAAAAAEVLLKTQCVFEDVSGAANASASVAPMLYVLSEPDTCYVGHVGYDPGVSNVMSLGWCVGSQRSVLHELTHVLGLHHEHQRAVSSPYLTRCAESACAPNADNCVVLQDADFGNDDDRPRHRPQTGEADFEFDLESIMMYPLGRQDACDLDLTTAGVFWLRGTGGLASTSDVGTATTLSPEDARAITEHYLTAISNAGCTGGSVPYCGQAGRCVRASIIGDGQCDVAAACYGNDGGDCIEGATHARVDVTDAGVWARASMGVALVFGVVAVACMIHRRRRDASQTREIVDADVVL
jgi:hypothetical protein